MLLQQSPRHAQAAPAVAEQFQIARMVNVAVVDRYLVNRDAISEPFGFIGRPAARRRHQIHRDILGPCHFLQQVIVDHSGAAPERREFVIEHEDTNDGYLLVHARATYNGRCLTSSEIRPMYSPMTPMVIN